MNFDTILLIALGRHPLLILSKLGIKATNGFRPTAVS